MTKNLEELTSNWQDEKLDDGLYYIRLENGKTPIAELETWCRYDDEVEEPYKTSQEFFGYPKDIISEVLAPVPSYYHFVELTEKIKTLSSENERLLNLQAVKNKEIEELESHSLAKKEGEEIVAELTNENNDLRSLLKECDGCVRCLRAYGVADCNGNNLNDLITKIEEVLKQSQDRRFV